MRGICVGGCSGKQLWYGRTSFRVNNFDARGDLPPKVLCPIWSALSDHVTCPRRPSFLSTPLPAPKTFTFKHQHHCATYYQTNTKRSLTSFAISQTISISGFLILSLCRKHYKLSFSLHEIAARLLSPSNMMSATTTRWLLCLVFTTIASQTAANLVPEIDSQIKQVAIIGIYEAFFIFCPVFLTLLVCFLRVRCGSPARYHIARDMMLQRGSRSCALIRFVAYSLELV